MRLHGQSVCLTVKGVFASLPTDMQLGTFVKVGGVVYCKHVRFID